MEEPSWNNLVVESEVQKVDIDGLLRAAVKRLCKQVVVQALLAIYTSASGIHLKLVILIAEFMCTWLGGLLLKVL